MRTDALIEINGKYSSENGNDIIEMTTLGSFVHMNNTYYVTYRESEGEQNETVTTIKIEDNNKITLSRKGEVNSRLFLEKGQRHLCHYDVGFTEFMMGVFAKDISVDLTEKGGRVFMSYTLDINSDLISKNEIDIKIKEA